MVQLASIKIEKLDLSEKDKIKGIISHFIVTKRN